MLPLTNTLHFNLREYASSTVRTAQTSPQMWKWMRRKMPSSRLTKVFYLSKPWPCVLASAASSSQHNIIPKRERHINKSEKYTTWRDEHRRRREIIWNSIGEKRESRHEESGFLMVFAFDSVFVCWGKLGPQTDDVSSINVPVYKKIVHVHILLCIMIRTIKFLSGWNQLKTS